jgi:hypothetical protein
MEFEMDTIHVDGIKTKFEYDIGSPETIRNNRKNGIQKIFIYGYSKTGRFCRVGNVSLPLGMLQGKGGTCITNGKKYELKRRDFAHV